MKAEKVIRTRLALLENAKNMVLCPPIFTSDPESKDWLYEPGAINPVSKGEHLSFSNPKATLESLNAEMASLHWVLED